MEPERRLVLTLREGVTLHEVLADAPDQLIAGRVQSLTTFSNDTYGDSHKDPLEKSTPEQEESRYHSPFYYSLGKRQKEYYRTFTLDTSDGEAFRQFADLLDRHRDLLEEYYQDGYIEFFAPLPTDPNFDRQRDIFERLHITEAWDQAGRGAGVIVSVIDTGVLPTHPDLRPNLWRRSGSTDFGFPNGGPMRDGAAGNGHGTCVAGLIAAAANNQGVVGMAPDVQVMAHRLELRGDVAFMSECQQAILDADKNKARIVNCSFGVIPGLPDAEEKLADAINAHSTKMLFVFAAGNENRTIKFNTFFNRLNNVLKVGVLDQNDRRFKGAGGSNFGKDVVYAYHNAYTTLAGAQFYGTFGNTSAGAPQVSAVAALLLGYNNGLSPARMKNIIESTVDRLPNLPSHEGLGRVNALAAALETARQVGPLAV